PRHSADLARLLPTADAVVDEHRAERGEPSVSHRRSRRLVAHGQVGEGDAARTEVAGLRMKTLAALILGLALATSASGAVRSDPGVTSTSILLGGTAALSGPESAYYAPVAKGAQAYFAYVNARGGVFGRKITYQVVDDAYDPAQTVQATRQLVQDRKSVV